MATSHVAVIVVHGVGDPGINTSVGNIGAILLALRDQEHTRFQPFTCESIQIGVRAAPVAESSQPSHNAENEAQRLKWLDERAPELANRERHPVDTSAESVQDNVAYTRDQLLNYKAGVGRNESTYSTTRLVGVRRGRDGTQEKTVHLYEMYWADLVSVRKGLRLLEDLYQLLFHIAHLGLLAVNSATAKLEYAKSDLWQSFAFFHRWAVRCLTLSIPILNLMAIPVVAFALTSLIPTDAMPAVAYVLIAAILFAASGAIVFSMASREYSRRKRASVVASIIGIAVLLALACWSRSEASEVFVGLVGFAVAMAGVFMLLGGYEKIRPGAFRCGIGIGLVVVADMLWESIHTIFKTIDYRNLSAAIRVAGLLLGLLALCWGALFILNIASLVRARSALRAIPDLERQAGRRIVATALLTLALPTVSFFLLTTLVSTGVLTVILKSVGNNQYQSGGLAQALIYGVHLPPTTKPIHTIVEQYWAVIAGGALILLAPLLGIALICVIWTLAPSVLSELKVPKDDAGRRKVYASWLDRSSGRLLFAGALLYFTSLCIAPAGVVGFILFNPETTRNLPDADIWMTRLFASLGAIVAGVGTFWLLPKKLGDFFGRIAVPIRAALDVDAYLRLFPLSANPKARIFARYASLLRYITNWVSPTNPNARYDAIVIVSHSQGTVITTDLFRYLKISGTQDQSLARLDATDLVGDKIPVQLLTLGCPLRQLYGLCLPYLYGWTNVIRTNGKSLTEQMGIKRWINAFRSGDYIGRFLWNDQAYWAKKYEKGVDEFCVGPGAHVHYWDGTAEVVAQVIDDLIVG